MLIFYMMFGSSIYFLNLGLPPGDEIMSSSMGFWVIDAFQTQYEHSLGEFSLHAYGGEYQELLVVSFIAITFLVMIVLLNMLIAIMGDIFD